MDNTEKMHLNSTFHYIWHFLNYLGKFLQWLIAVSQETNIYQWIYETYSHTRSSNNKSNRTISSYILSCITCVNTGNCATAFEFLQSFRTPQFRWDFKSYKLWNLKTSQITFLQCDPAVVSFVFTNIWRTTICSVFISPYRGLLLLLFANK